MKMLNRLIAVFLLAIAATTALARGHGDLFSPSPQNLVWMETPDVVAFQVFDAPFVKGPTITLPDGVNAGPPDPGAYFATLTRFDTAKPGNPSESANTTGPFKNFDHFFDLTPTTGRLDRLAIGGGPVATNPSTFTVAGSNGQNLTVTQVYVPTIESVDEGQSGSVQMRVTIMLQLASKPVNGVTYTISVTGNTFAPVVFTYDEHHTRAGGLRASFVGFRPSDPLKYAYLSSRLYGGANHGAVDFAGTYGITQVLLIDAKGNIVKTIDGTHGFAKRIDVNSKEPTWDYYNSTSAGIDVADLSQNWQITAVVKGATTTYTVPGHTVSIGDKIRVRGLNMANGTTNVDQIGVGNTGLQPWTAQTVTNVSGNDITTNFVSTPFANAVIPSGYREDLAGYDSRLYKTFNTNRSATSVWGIDISDVVTPGVYFLYVPGWGISDPFPINDNAYQLATQIVHSGLYNLRMGPPTNRTAYNRYYTMRDGGPAPPGTTSSAGTVQTTGIQTYWTWLPALWATEKSSGPNYGTANIIPSGQGGFADRGFGTVSNITWAGGTATVTTSAPHGLSAGTHPVGIVGASPSGWNTPNSLTQLTVTGASSFTYPLASNPGSFTSATWTTGWADMTRRAVDAYPGAQDAADDDDLANDHVGAWESLAFVFEGLALNGRFTGLKVEPASVVSDPVLFAGTESLPPIFHELVYYSYAYLRLQNMDPAKDDYGSLPGGFGLGHFAVQAPVDSALQNYEGTDPDGGNPQTGPTTIGAYIYAADPISTAGFAILFAKMSIICNEYGLTTAANLYLARSELAYAWANRVWQRTSVADWLPNTVYASNAWVRNGGNLYLGIGTGTSAASGGPTTTAANITDNTMHWAYIEAQDGAADTNFYWNSFLNLQARMGISGAQYLTNITAVAAQFSKIAMSTTMWRATGNYTKYVNNLLITNSNYALVAGASQITLDYLKMSGDPNYSITIQNYFFAHGFDSINGTIPDQPIDPAASYMGAVGAGTGPNGPGPGGSAFGRWVSAHMLEKAGGISPSTSKYLKGMIAQTAFELGAHPSGKSQPTGFGPRPTVFMDFTDAQVRSIPVPPGIYRFWYSPQGWSVLGTLGIPSAFKENANGDGSLNYVAEDTMGLNEGAPSYGHFKLVEPWRFGQSYWEFTPMGSTLISTSEFSLANQMNIMLRLLWINGWDKSWLLKRDLDPAANDNTPMYLNHAA